MMKCLLPMMIGAGLLAPVVCAAQLAAPQWRQPAIDSTHVVGTAVKVMLDYPQQPAPDGDPDSPSSPKAPTNISELLQAFDGVVLTMPGNELKGAHGQMRVAVTAAKAQVQTTQLWNWYDSCAATAQSSSCGHDPYIFHLSPEGVTVVLSGCGAGSSGLAGGSAEFRWTDFVALGGLSGTTKTWTFQRNSFWSSCSANSGPND